MKLAQAQFNLGREDEAARSLERAPASNGSLPEVRELRARLDQVDRLRSLAGKVEANPGDPAVARRPPAEPRRGGPCQVGQPERAGRHLEGAERGRRARQGAGVNREGNAYRPEHPQVPAPARLVGPPNLRPRTTRAASFSPPPPPPPPESRRAAGAECRDNGGVSRHAKPHLRCPGCRMHRTLCICGLLPRLETRTRVVLVVHQLEADKPTNTGLLAARCLTNSAIVYRGRAPDGADALTHAPRTTATPAFSDVPGAQL